MPTANLIRACALAILAATISGGAVANAQSSGDAGLQRLVNDVAFQLDLSYRFNRQELNDRRATVQAALAAWGESSRSQADNETLASWLREAIRTSMPGTRQSLPAIPDFKTIAATEPLPGPSKTVDSTRATTRETQLSTTSAMEVGPEKTSEHTMMRPASATSTEVEKKSVPADVSEREEPLADFWSPHPANQELPDDLTTGDPFRDDPLPTDDDLFLE